MTLDRIRAHDSARFFRSTASLVVILWSTVCLSLLPSSTTHAAEEEPGVAVVDIRSAQGSAIEARDALVVELGRYRVRVIEDDPSLRSARDDARAAGLAATLARARTLAAEGKDLFDRQDPAGAETKFRAAADLLEEEPCALEGSADLVENYLFLAQIFFATDRAALVREVFRRVVQLAPELVLDPSRYPPRLIRAYDAVRAELLTGPLGTLHVDASPPGAEVTLDGLPRGTTPIDLVNLPPGVHRLCVQRDGFAPWFRPVDVSSFRAERLSAELAVARLDGIEPAFSDDPAAVRDWFARIAEATGADLLIAGRIVDANVELRAWSRAARAFGTVVRLPESSSARQRVEAVLEDAVERRWITPVAARPSIAAGGGALDDTAPYGIRVGMQVGADRGIDRARVNFPRGPAEGIRIALDRRLRARWVVAVESGFELRTQGGIILVDRNRERISPGERGVSGIDVTVPLDLTVRWYQGLSTWAPYTTAGAGMRMDWLTWDDTMPESGVVASWGFGGGAWLGAGIERALGPRSAVSLEARAGAARSSRRTLILRSTNSADRRVPSDPGLEANVRAALVWRKTF